MDWFTLLIIAFIAGWFLLPRLRWIKTKEAAQRLREGAVLLDVRTPGEYQRMKVPGSVNLPLGGLAREVGKAGLKPEQPVLVYCASGSRSAAAARQLKAMGYQQVWNLGSYARARKAWQLHKEA